jgi:hypothetical protein
MALSRIAALVAAAGLVVGACTASAATSAPSTGPSVPPTASPVASPSASGSSLILRVALEGGFISPGALRARLPTISAYADGTIITEGMTPAIYPGALVPTLVYRSVGPVGATGILDAATAAGLAGADASYGPGPVPDGAMTVITVIHDGHQTVSRFSSLAPQQIQPGGATTDPVLSATEQLLGRLMGTDLFGGTAGRSGTYVPAGFQVFATPGLPVVSDPSLAPRPVSWPLATPLASFGKADTVGADGARVGVVVGDDALTRRPILEAATQITPFTSGGSSWTLGVKPLLPDEVAALGG